MMRLMNKYKKQICMVAIFAQLFVWIPAKMTYAQIKFKKGGAVSAAQIDDESSNFENDAGMLLINITSGNVLQSSESKTGFFSLDVRRLAFLTAILNMDVLNEVITIEEKEELILEKNVLELSAGDEIAVSELLMYYMYTASEEVRKVILSGCAFELDELLEKLNGVIGNRMVKTSLAKDIFVIKSQTTCAYDLYVFIDELMKCDWFAKNIGITSFSVSWIDADGNEKTASVEDKSYGTVKAAIPEGFVFSGHFTSKDAEGVSQIVLFEDEKGNGYISVVIGAALMDQLSHTSKKVMRTLKGEEYLTSEQEKENEEATPTPTPTPIVKQEYSTPTFSKSSTYIPKINSGLERYGEVMPPNGNENEKYQYLLGTDERHYTFYEPPKGYASEAQAAQQMVTITVPVWNINKSGGKYSSKYDVTVNKKLAANVKAIFDEIYALSMQFPIKDLRGYGYRQTGGVGLNNVDLMSMHSYGAAIDINPGDYDNDYFLGKGNDLRDKSNPYCIPDEVIEIFEKYGWNWGGNFEICADTMHFQYLGLEFLSYQGNDPFRELTLQGGYKGLDVWNLQIRLREIGYRVTVDGVYGKETESVIKKFQSKQGLEVTGVVDYLTWETLINLTHFMSYVF